MIQDISSITIETHTLCNASCLICPNYKNRRIQYFTPLDDFKKTLELFPNLKEVVLCGMYEPLIDNRLPQIFDIIKSINDEIKISLFTNASLLDKWENLIMENVSYINFSVHGLSSNTYNTIMKGLDRDKVYKNIINFCEKKKKTPITNVSFIRTSINIKELSQFIIFWKHYVDNVSNFELMNWNNSIYNYTTLLDRSKMTNRECPMFENPIVIDAFGNIVRCCYNFSFNYGNVREDGLSKWLLKNRTSKTYPDIKCIKCDGWKI